MTAVHRVVALIEAPRLDRARARLDGLGVRERDIRVEPAAGPGQRKADDRHRSARPLRRSHLVLARTVGAVPGAFAGLAITLGVGLSVAPAVLMITAGAALGMVAVTGRPQSTAEDSSASVVDLHPGRSVYVEARCSPDQVGPVRDALRVVGGVLVEDTARPPRAGAQPVADGAASVEPSAVEDPQPTPPAGFTPVPQ